MFAFAANTLTSGVIEDVEKNPTFAAFIARAGKEYATLSATPKEYAAFVEQISKMWFEQPNWTDAELKAIDAPVLVVDGDHDEAIKRAHTEYIAATIPHAGLLILPNVSHFAFLQDPEPIQLCHPPFPRRRMTIEMSSAQLRSGAGVLGRGEVPEPHDGQNSWVCVDLAKYWK